MDEEATEVQCCPVDGRPTKERCPAKKEKFRINRKLLPIKIFFFMSNAAMACLIPYLVVFTKKQGLSSEESGILIGFMPFLAFLTQPIVGMLADRWKKHKAVLMTVTVTTGVFIILITTVPARSRRDVIHGDVVMTCSPRLPLSVRYCVADGSADVSETTVDDGCGGVDDVEGLRSSESGNDTSSNAGCNIRGDDERSKSSCPQNVINVLNAMQQDDNKTVASEAVCHVTCPSQIGNGGTGRICLTNITLAASYSSHKGCEAAEYHSFLRTFEIRSLQRQLTDSPNNAVNSSIAYSENERNKGCSDIFRVSSLVVDNHPFSTVYCESRRELRCQIRCHLHSGHACGASVSFFDLTFWLIFVFYLVGFLAQSPIIPMSDAVCYSLLGEEWRKYGHQRVWGTIGWLLVSIATSVGVYLHEGLDYSLMFYSYGALMGVCTVVAYFIRIPTNVCCGNMLRNMCQVLVLPKVLALLAVALVFGSMFGAIGFVFWYLEELGAPPQIFGPFNVVGVATEIPAFFLVGRLIRRIGPIPCVCAAMALMSLRLLGYALLGDPWLVLLLEPLHGVLVALMYASATTYVAWVSPPGMAATSQGLLGAVMHILGRAIGSILAGWLFGLVGPRATFAVYAGTGFLVTSVYALLHRYVLGELSPPAHDTDMNIKENGYVTDKDTQLPLVAIPSVDKPLSSAVDKTTVTAPDERPTEDTAYAQPPADSCDPLLSTTGHFRCDPHVAPVESDSSDPRVSGGTRQI